MNQRSAGQRWAETSLAIVSPGRNTRTGWCRAAGVLAVVLGLSGLNASCDAQSETLTLQGLAPQLTFDDNSMTPRMWDLFGDHTGFDIVDSTAGTTPFGIAPGASTNSFFIQSNGRIGIGTMMPSSTVHAITPAVNNGSESLAKFSITDDAIGSLEINNATSTNGLLVPRLQGRSNSQNAALIMEGLIANDVGGNPCIVYNAAKISGGAVVNRPMVVYRNNNAAKVTVAANGNITANAFITASSRELKDRITDLPSDKASAALRQLMPVEFVYKDDATADVRIGFIAEDVPDIIAEPERKSVPVMDVVALVTRVVKDQQQTIDDQKKSIDELRKSNDDQQKLNELLMQRLSQLEGRMQDK